jgi:hypothetical protein
VRKHVVHYELSNRSGSARTAYLPLEYVDNARVRGTDALAYDEAKRRAQGVFEIEPAQTRELILHVEEGLSESYPLPALSLGRVKKLAAASSLPAWQRRLLDASVTWLAKARRAEQRIHSTEAQLKRVSARMVELRDTLRVLPRTQSKAGAPLVRRLLATEQLQSSLTRKLEALKQAKRRLLLRARRELGRLNHKPKLSQSSTSKTRQS